MHADPKGVLTGVHFLDGDHACCEGTLAAGARFAAGYPITPSTEVVERFAWQNPHRRRHLHPDGGRTGRFHRHPRRGLGRRQGLHGHLRPRLLPHDGAHRLRRHDRNPLRVRQRAARRTLHRPAHPARAGRHDAGPLGIARRLRHHRALPQLAAGMLRPDHHGLQPVRRVPRPGDDDARRVRRPHDRKGGDPRRPTRSPSRPRRFTTSSPRTSSASSSRSETWCPTWCTPATATASTSPASPTTSAAIPA